MGKIKSVDLRYYRGRFPMEWDDGLKLGMGHGPAGQRERGDYPKGFHDWPLDRRNAWFAGFNVGRLIRVGADRHV